MADESPEERYPEERHEERQNDRWTVRGVPKAYTERAVAAAQRRKIPLGAYVCEALDLADRHERRLNVEVMLPAPPAPSDRFDLAAFADRVVVLDRMIDAASKLAAQPNIPDVFRKRATRALNRAMLVFAKQGATAALPALTFEGADK